VAVAVEVSRPATTGGPAQPPTAASLERLPPREAFAYLVGTTSDARRLTRATVGQACREQPPAAVARQALSGDLSRATTMSESVVALLRADRRRLLALSHGRALVSLVREVAGWSVTADAGYQAWLQDLQATGCYSAPTNDLHYLQAQQAAAREGVAARELSAIWDQATASVRTAAAQADGQT